MTQIYNHEQIKGLRTAGGILTSVHDLAKEYIHEFTGRNDSILDLVELDSEIGKWIAEFSALSILNGYSNPEHPETKFSAHSCISVGSTLVHGVPRGSIHVGDQAKEKIFTVDIALKYKGWVADAARTYTNQRAITSLTLRALIIALKESTDEFIREIHAGWTLMDIGLLIQEIAQERGFTVPLEYGGHGIGQELHMQPHIPCFWKDGWPNITLKAGMVICIEPMFIAGDNKLKISADGWSVKTRDRSPCAHKEIMLLIESRSCEVLAY